MAAGTKGKMAKQKKAGFAGRQTESLPARLLKDMRKKLDSLCDDSAGGRLLYYICICADLRHPAGI